MQPNHLRHKPRNFTSKHPVPWREGERDRLIAEALAEGRVTQVARGIRGYDDRSAAEIVGRLPQRR